LCLLLRTVCVKPWRSSENEWCLRLFYKIDANSSQWIVNVGAKSRGKTFSDRNPKNTLCIISQGCKRISREVRTCGKRVSDLLKENLCGKPSPTSSLIPKLNFIGNSATYGYDTDSGFDLHSLDGTGWYLWAIWCW